MKLIVAFIFVFGVCANASPFHRYGWEDGMEYVYRYESQVLTGIPDIRKEQAGGVKLVSNVKVQSMADYTLRIKFEDPKLISFNEVIVPQTETGRVLLEEVVSGKVSGEEENELPSEFKHFLMTPYLVRVKGGKMESFQVSQREPVGITNVKRAFLTQIYLDMSGYLNSGLEPQQVGEALGQTERILKEELSGRMRSSDGYREFVTYEEAIQGECKTIYALSEVPAFKAAEMEELWKIQKARYAGEHLEVAEGERFCEGKRYFKLTKTRDFNKCKIRPFFQKWTGMDGDCDLSKSSCGAIYGHMARASYYICGSINDFTIRRMVMDDEKVTYPLTYHTDEKLKSWSKSTLDLLVKKPISGKLPLPSDTKVERSLVYRFPSQESWSGHHGGHNSNSIKESVLRETKERYGFLPILPMPGLTEAPQSLIPRTLPEGEIVRKASEVIRKIAYLMYESPESCSSKEDVVGLLMTVVKHLRHLGLDHLKKLESEVEGPKHLRQVFYEVLVKVGTNPSVMLVKERLIEGRWSGFLKESEIVHLVQGTIRNVRTPTPELMRELVKMVKVMKQGRINTSGINMNSLFTMSLLQLSNLFYNAYVHPTNMYTKYPVHVYGVFGTNRSEVLTAEYLPFLEHLISEERFEGRGMEEAESEAEKVKMVAIVALGKLGHIRTLRKLTEVIEGKHSTRGQDQPFVRALAVYSLKRLAKRRPSEVKALLMPVIMNPAEHDQIRIAAISVMAFARPTTAQLQKLVMLTWEDQLSKQVASFIDSTMENLSNSPAPELVSTGRKAAAVRHLLKPSSLGMQYSHNHHSETLIGYLNAIFSQKVHVTNSKAGLLPTRVAVSRDLMGVHGAWKVKGPSFTSYIQGMDRIIDDFLYIMGQTDKVSEAVKEQLRQVAEELRMEKPDQEYSPRAFILSRMFGFENAYMVDIKSVMEALESAGSALASSDRGSIRKEFSLFRAYKIVEADTLGVTLMGLPYVFQSTSSAIITSNGTISTGTEGGLRAKAKVLPVVNFKTQIDSGVLIPFTQKFVGASLEVGVHSSLSFELEAKMEGNEIKMAIKVPQEHHREQTETLHGFVLPYTVIDSYVSMRPTTLAHFKKPILTGLPKKIVEKQVFPRSFGLHCELKLESDNEFIDFASYYHKIKEHSIVSIMTFPSILVSSLRHTSAKILFSPARSETKEIEFVLKLGSQRHGIINHEVEEIKEAIIKHEMHSLKQALESMTEGSKTHMVHLDAILKGESGQKTIKAGIVLGYKPLSHHKTKSVLAIDVKPGHLGEGGETYGILWECELEMPKVEYRWNVEKLLAQNLRMKLDSKIKFGRHSGPGSHQEVKVKAEFLKTEEQIKSVREAVEYQKCEQEIREGKLLSPICMKVRHEAASLDKLVLSVEVPSRVSRMWLWRMLEGIVFSDYFPMVQRLSQNYEVEVEVEDEVDTKKVMIEGRIDRVGQFAKAKVTYGQTEYEIKGVPVPRMIRWFMPFSVRNNLYYWFLQRATSNQAPASCRVEPKFVGTFDNVTYPYAINDCGHVLVIDRRRVIPVAIMTRTYPGSNGMQKSVKILAGKFDIELIPTAGVNAGISSSSGGSGVAGEKNGPIEVKVNGREVTIERGQTFAEKSAKTGRIVFEVERYMDDVYQVYVQDQWLEVMTNGKHIEVVVPQTFRARSAGLCGDLNGEKTTDLKSPRMCILKAKVAGVAYMLGKSSGGRREEGGVAPQCSGIPSELKEEYEEEERECIKEHVIPTHLASHLHQLPHLVKPKVASHAILITRFDVCLSREAVDVHPGKVRDDGGLLPAYKKPRVLTFVCVPKQSAMSGSLLWRARAGENLGSVLKRMPIAFKKHIHGDLSEVQVPGLEDSLRRSHFHQNQMNHFQNEYYNQNQYQNQMVEEEEEMMAMDHFRSQEGFSNDYHQHHHNQQYNSSPYNRKYLSEYEEESSSYEYPPSHMRKANNHRHHKKAYLNGASLIEDEEEDMYQKFPRSSSYSAAASSIME